jgi:hypothetical protein
MHSRDIKKGTLRSILREAGISVEEFLASLKTPPAVLLMGAGPQCEWDNPIRMARSFMDWAVGPLTPGRIGAVFGFVGGIALAMLGGWIVYGDISNLYPMFAIAVGGPVGAVVGFVLGRVLGRPRPAP